MSAVTSSVIHKVLSTRYGKNSFAQFVVGVVKQEVDVRRATPTSTTTLLTANLVMPYTEEEELWINAQFKFVEEAFRYYHLWGGARVRRFLGWE